MPYAIKKVKKGWVVKNTQTGKIHGTHSTKTKALKQFKLLQGIEHGWKPTFSQNALKSKIK